MPITPNAPCHERWSELSPTTSEARYCQKCDKTVVDMTALTRRQAEKLLVQAGGELCGRLRVDPSGAPVFRREAQRAPGLLGLATASLLAACGSTTEESGSSTGVAASLESSSPETTTGGDHLLEAPPGAGTSGSLARPMMPLADDRPTTSVSTAETEAPPATIASLDPMADTDAEVVPTADQLLLTERKEEDRHPARHAGRHRSVRTVDTDPPDTTTNTTTGRRRNNGSHTVSVAPTTPSAPSINTPPVEMYLGGISYTP